MTEMPIETPDWTATIDEPGRQIVVTHVDGEEIALPYHWRPKDIDLFFSHLKRQFELGRRIGWAEKARAILRELGEGQP